MILQLETLIKSHNILEHILVIKILNEKIVILLITWRLQFRSVTQIFNKWLFDVANVGRSLALIRRDGFYKIGRYFTGPGELR